MAKKRIKDGKGEHELTAESTKNTEVLADGHHHNQAGGVATNSRTRTRMIGLTAIISVAGFAMKILKYKTAMGHDIASLDSEVNRMMAQEGYKPYGPQYFAPSDAPEAVDKKTFFQPMVMEGFQG